MRGGPVASDIDAYIAAAPAAVRARLTQLRTTIAKAAPGATEAIVYGMPTFRLHGNLVHFAVFAKHIGFYPGPAAIIAHAADLTPYATSKGAIQFPLDTPLPLSLVKKITAYRVTESTAVAQARSAKKAAARPVKKTGAPAAKTATAGRTSAKTTTPAATTTPRRRSR